MTSPSFLFLQEQGAPLIDAVLDQHRLRGTGYKTGEGSCDLGKWEGPDSLSGVTHESRLLRLEQQLLGLLTKSKVN